MCCSVNGYVYPVCCVFDSVCEMFGETILNCLVVVVIFRLMLWKCLVCVEVLCLIYRVWSSKECACCACDSIVHLSVPSIVFVYVFVCRKLSPRLRV